MKTVSVAVLGAGIAGLSFAAQVTKIPHVSLKVFEKEEFAGGRVFSRELGHGIVADLGANIIEFQNQQQEKTVRHFLRDIHQGQSSTQSLRLLKQPFLVYDKDLRQGDYYKPRYCYEGGFNKLIFDLVASINKESMIFGVSITKIQKVSKGWRLIGHNGEEHGQYDYLILALDGPAALEILNTSKLYQHTELIAFLSQTQYTTQISSAFQLLNHPQFSCILFKNHPLTFMSSHQEKYPQSLKKIVMIQMDERFSSDHFGQSEEEIGQKILEQIPETMQKWIGQCLAVKRWKPSLIRKKTPRSFQSFQNLSDHLLVAGDVVQGSSRVAGAIETATQSFRLFVQQISHL